MGNLQPAPPRLEPLLRPRSVAVIGASTNPSKIGSLVVANLLSHGFGGRLFPVNTGASPVLGIVSAASLAEVPQPLDLVIVALPAAQALPAVQQAAALGAKACIVLSAGFAEVGVDQHGLATAAAASGMVLLGPNCLGAINIADGIYCTFSGVAASGAVATGPVGIVSQSGGFGVSAYIAARERDLGLSHVIMTGKEAQLQLADGLEWLAHDPQTRCILAFMETCRCGERLLRALEAARSAGKPVVVVKGGSSLAGARAARAHTAAAAGEDRVYQAVFDRMGALRASSLEEAMDLVDALSCLPSVRGSRLGILTVSGGMGILMADAAEDAGLQLPALPREIQDRIRARAPLGSADNPVDLTGAIMADRALEHDVVDALAGSGLYDALVVSHAAGTGTTARGRELAGHLLDLRQGYPGTPVAVCNVFDRETTRRLRDGGILPMADHVRIVRVLAKLARLARLPSRWTGADASAANEAAIAVPWNLDGVALRISRSTHEPFGTFVWLEPAGLPGLRKGLLAPFAETDAAELINRCAWLPPAAAADAGRTALVQALLRVGGGGFSLRPDRIGEEE